MRSASMGGKIGSAQPCPASTGTRRWRRARRAAKEPPWEKAGRSVVTPRLASGMSRSDGPSAGPAAVPRVGQEASEVPGVGDLELLAGQLDLASRRAVAAGAVVEHGVAARGEPDVVPAHGLVRGSAAVRSGAAAGGAQILGLRVEEAV